EDRADLLHADERAGGAAVRGRRARVEVPGAAGADAQPVLEELRSIRRRVKVLVTGGTGFVGQAIAHELRAQGRDLRPLVRDAGRAARLASWGAELARGDVTDPASLAAAADGCTHVIHLVAIIRGSDADFERVMTGGTRNVIAAAREAGVERFVLM